MTHKEAIKESFKRVFGWFNFKKNFKNYKEEIKGKEYSDSFVEYEDEHLYQPKGNVIKEGQFSDNKRLKKKADKVRGINFFSLPLLLKRDCQMNYTYYNLLFHYLIAFLGVAVVGLIFELDLIPVLILCFVYFLFGPSFVYFHYRKKHEEKVFSDCVRYIEQMLYSFTRKSKILIALQECRLVSEFNVNLTKAIDFAINKLTVASSDNKADIYSSALKEIEAVLPCSRIRNLHEFLAEVENVGGKHVTALEIMLEDLREWDVRTSQFQKNQAVKGAGMLLSIIMSLGTVLFMSNVLPADMGGDISGFALYQWLTTIVIIVMFFIYRVSARKLTRSWVVDGAEMDQDVIDSDCEKIKAYFETKKGIKPIFALSRTKKELEKKFPSWVMRFALLASSQSIPSALRNSLASCPNVMRAELEKLVEGIDAHPTSIEPYLNFFDYFKDLPQVRSMMLMIYSLSELGNDEIDKHVLSIVKRNYALQATSEEIENEEKLAKFSVYVTAPMILACIVMMVDVAMIVLNMISKVSADLHF